MNTKDLTTAEGVLEWATSRTLGRRAFEPVEVGTQRMMADRETAAEIARAMRAWALVKAHNPVKYADGYNFAFQELRAAAESEKK